jgi:hypothetical protein
VLIRLCSVPGYQLPAMTERRMLSDLDNFIVHLPALAGAWWLR